MQNFLKGRIDSDPSKIIFYRGGSLFNGFGNSVTYGNNIYLTSGAYINYSVGGIKHKFHEIWHTSQNAKLGFNASHHAFGYVAYTSHDNSPLETAANDFAENTYADFKKAGLDKTCIF